jgi:transposase
VDVPKARVVACVIAPGAGGAPCKAVRTFGTMRADLLPLVDWLVEVGCTAVALESTGSDWKPLSNLLEGVVEQGLVVNAAHSKQVPGRKTDVKDAEWLADLLRHGLLRASFIPDRPPREWRALTRYRTSLIRARTAEVNRVQTVLAGANIKLSVVASALSGVSGRAMLAALLDGCTDAAALAQLAQGQRRAKIPQLEQALVGQGGAHQRFMLAQQRIHSDTLDELSARVSAQSAQRVHPCAQESAQLDGVTGGGLRTAEAVVAEIGVDLSRFPSADHRTAWAGLAPGSNESAGKRRSGKTRKGSPWLRAVLIAAAHAAGRTKDTYLYLGALYRRLLARTGKKRAAVAVARHILVIVYHILRDHEPSHALGAASREQRDRQAVAGRRVRRLAALGYDVSLQPKQPAA